MPKKKKLSKVQRWKEQDRFSDLYGDTCDDRFAFIAGYTSGGAPYGSTWEEISDLLASNEIAIFAISTYNTDYVLTKEKDFRQALKILDMSGFAIEDHGSGTERNVLSGSIGDPE